MVKVSKIEHTIYTKAVKAIKIPVLIDSDIRNQIKRAYATAIVEVGVAESHYITERMPRILNRFRQYQSGWGVELNKVAEALFNLFAEAQKSPRLLLPETERVLVAALFYLCNPYDVIPDFSPGIGYVDDALVLNECLRKIKKIQPALYKKLFDS